MFRRVSYVNTTNSSDSKEFKTLFFQKRTQNIIFFTFDNTHTNSVGLVNYFYIQPDFFILCISDLRQQFAMADPFLDTL